MKYYIIAGEASGDLHASNLMKQLKVEDSSADFRCWGGDLMQAQGGVLVKHYRDLAFMGFIEVLRNIRTIFRNISFCKRDILAYRPDALILVDYPGFNLRIAEFAHKQKIKVIYYISPQVWAWKKSRVYKIKKVVDRMIVILPFEKDFYAKYDYDVDYVGHPLLDVDKLSKIDNEEKPPLREGQKPIVALLPGSRKQEIKRMLPVMLSTAKKFPDHQFIISQAPSIDKEFYTSIIGEQNFELRSGNPWSILKEAEAALVTSGTATLETALMRIPEVVCYKGNRLSFLIARKMVDVKYISLVNLVMDREIVKELIQDEFNEESLADELSHILDPEIKSRMKHQFDDLRMLLGGSGASEKAASIITSQL
jgi:lipid-A-disaccharide synthase